jgi:predicted transcriptional regulator
LETGEAFMKDLLQTFQTKKTTTVATLLKRMIDKDFVAYNEFGNSENTIHW